MGFYIDPPDMSKEEFLKHHGQEISHAEFVHWPFTSYLLPVCLVDNGAFTAAGIGYCKEERDTFGRIDNRPKKYYIVPRELLKPYLPEEPE